jgi:hypothetical protein
MFSLMEGKAAGLALLGDVCIRDGSMGHSQAMALHMSFSSPSPPHFVYHVLFPAYVSSSRSRPSFSVLPLCSALFFHIFTFPDSAQSA